MVVRLRGRMLGWPSRERGLEKGLGECEFSRVATGEGMLYSPLQMQEVTAAKSRRLTPAFYMIL